jgi:hypothetical protein
MQQVADAIVNQIADAIYEYLKINPHAADNVHGIKLWWLSPELEIPDMVLEKSLDLLIRRKIIKKTKLSDGSVIYTKFEHVIPLKDSP